MRLAALLKVRRKVVTRSPRTDLALLLKGEWNEEDHPRDEDGKWTDKDGDGGGGGRDDKTSSRVEPSWQAISDYTQLSHDEINDYLRGTANFSGAAREDAKELADSIKAAFDDPKFYDTTSKKVTVFRGIENHGVFSRLSKAKEGDVISDKAFLSTSTSEEIAISAAGGRFPVTESVVLEISVPKGVRYLSGRRDEKEMIFNTKTKMKVKSVDVVPGESFGASVATLKVEMVK